MCAMVTASHSLCSCLQANFHPPYAHPIKLQTDLKPCCDEEYRLTTRCGYCICSHINFLEKEIVCMEGKLGALCSINRFEPGSMCHIDLAYF